MAKELLEAASANFSIFNYAALDLDNVRVAEEALYNILFLDLSNFLLGNKRKKS